jgi:hypothetical protein
MMQGESTDQGIFLAADRLWSMVDQKLNEAVGILAEEGINWNEWQTIGLGFAELAFASTFADIEGTREADLKAIHLYARLAAALQGSKIKKRSAIRVMALLSMAGTAYASRDFYRSDGAIPFFDLAADVYRVTGVLQEALTNCRVKTITGKQSGPTGGKVAAINKKSTPLGSWAVIQYLELGGKQPAQTFARWLQDRGIPEHLKDAKVTDHERVMADAIRSHLRVQRQAK